MQDYQIIDLLFERSDRGIALLKEKYGALCLTLALNLLHDASEAEECLNDTLLGVWNAIPPARPEMLSAFVCRITRNLALRRLDYLNAAKRSRRATLYLDELDEWIVEPQSVERQLDDKALAECINAFLASLGKDERRVFVLRYWYNYSIRDIASRLHFSESKTQSMLYRTRKKLRHDLTEKGYYHDKTGTHAHDRID